MTGYEIVSSHLEECPKCNTKNLITLRVVIFGTEAEEAEEDIPIEKRCLKCEPDIRKDIIANMELFHNLSNSQTTLITGLINSMNTNKQEIKKVDDITFKLSGELTKLAKRVKTLENK